MRAATRGTSLALERLPAVGSSAGVGAAPGDTELGAIGVDEVVEERGGRRGDVGEGVPGGGGFGFEGAPHGAGEEVGPLLGVERGGSARRKPSNVAW